ncbi:MAG: HTTM domain-containing protein [Candidatus Nanohaloarchaea archaeon]
MSGKTDRLKNWVGERIGIDARSLALFRVLAGLLVVVDIVLRSRNFRFFYTDSGVVPVELAKRFAGDSLSVYFLSGDPLYVGFLFILTVVFGLMMVFGYRTRLATVMSFVLVASLDIRNGLVTSYADTLFRHLLFWAIFLPLGKRFSVDAVLNSDRSGKEIVAGVASLAILMKVVSMYFVNGYLKLGSELWMSGKAAPLVIGRDSLSFLLGDYITYFPGLLKAGGLLWFGLLLFSPLLLITKGRKRDLYASALIVMELFLAVTVRIGAFPYVAIAGLVLFLQPSFWNTLFGSRLGPYLEKFRAWGERRAQGLDGSLLDFRLGLDDLLDFRGREVLKSVFLSVLLLNSLLVNMSTLGVVDARGAPGQQQVTELKSLADIDEPNWGIFAPNPNTDDRYFITAGLSSSGRLYDIHNGRNFTWDRPSRHLNDVWPTYRYRFYMPENLMNHEIEANYLRYLCENWEKGNETLEYISIYYVEEKVTMQTLNQPEDRFRVRQLYSSWGCGDRAPRHIVKRDYDGPGFNQTE